MRALFSNVALLIPILFFFNCSTTTPESEQQFLAPSEGTLLLIDDFTTIKWNAPDFKLATIEYSSDSGNTWSSETTLTVNDQTWGSYNWQIPDVTPTSNGCQIRIIDTIKSDTLISQFFTISGLDIISPKKGETVPKSKNYTIKWKTLKYSDAVLLISYDAGLNFSLLKPIATIKNSDDQWQNFNWIVGDSVSDQCVIQIKRYNGPDEEFETDFFSIK